MVSCGKSDSPILPENEFTQVKTVQSGDYTRALWGIWDISIDGDLMTPEIVPMRGPMFTANVTQFMQPPMQPVNMISLSIDPASDPATGYFVVDVMLKHPFPGLNYYNGFDVKGVFMSDSSGSLAYDSDAVFPVDDESVLLNADGYTRWWNWEEFGPPNTVFGPTYGKLAPPIPVSGTLNGYKYFCDAIDSETEDIAALAEAGSGFFSSISANTRRYELQFKMEADKILFDFQYAVDASWAEPDIAFNPDYPSEAFPSDAHMAEAWLIDVTDAGSTAWFVDGTDNGGELLLDIAVYDWQAGGASTVVDELSALWLEGEVVAAPVDLLSIATVSAGSLTSSVFQVELTDLTLTKSGLNEIWIIAESANPDTYQPNLENFDPGPFTWPDSNLASYLRTTVEISDTQTIFPPEVTSIDPTSGHQFDLINATVYGDYFQDGCSVELRGAVDIEAENEVWVDATEITCDFDLNGSPAGFYDVVVINPDMAEGSLDDGFEVLELDVIYVDDSNTSGTEDGTQTYPYNTITEGLAAASAGYEVWVDDSGVDYAGSVTLVADVVLKSYNWDDTDGDDMAVIYYNGGSGAAVNGADNATIDGFEINGLYTGIDCNGTSPDILNCRVVDINASGNWGTCRAIWLRNGSFAHLDGVEVWDVSNNSGNWVTFYGILIENCDASGGNNILIEHTNVHYLYTTGLLGGSYCDPHGLYISGSDGVVVENSIFNNISCGNYDNPYGVRINSSADVEITNVVIYNVKKNYYYGRATGLYFAGCTNLDVRNTIITNIKRSGGFQSAYGVIGTGSTYTLEYNDVWDCSTTTYSGVTPGTGSISSNPLYVTPGTDFTLQSGSPCINTGDPAIDDPDGSRSDMGAYGGPGGDW